MKSIRKIKIITIKIITIIIISVMCYVWLHPTHYKYCDIWIMGKSIEQVEAHYGEFDFEDDWRVGYYLYFGDGVEYYYWMKYDESGVVYEVYVGRQKGG